MPTPAELLDVALRAAGAGGERLSEGLRLRDREVALKGSRTSIVTWADEASQRAVVDVIEQSYPDHRILGEEGDAGRVDGDHTWIVDPLDGTTNYARGMPLWGVSVAVRATDGPLLAGVILSPATGETFSARRGGGTRHTMSDTDDVANALVATGLQSDDPAQISEYAARVERLHVRCRGVRSLGSPAIAMAYVATGRLDAFVGKDATYAWDIAAGTLLIEESGGRVTDLDGGPPNLDRGIADVVATNGKLHDELIGVLRERSD